MKDLGYANGWRETPEIVEKCGATHDRGDQGEKHRFYSKNVGRCLNEYGCLTCGYKYLVDSSD